MADAGEETDTAANRLEAALERIAALSVQRAAAVTQSAPGDDAPPGALPEVVERLDALIAHLREALDSGSA